MGLISKRRYGASQSFLGSARAIADILAQLGAVDPCAEAPPQVVDPAFLSWLNEATLPVMAPPPTGTPPTGTPPSTPPSTSSHLLQQPQHQHQQHQQPQQHQHPMHQHSQLQPQPQPQPHPLQHHMQQHHHHHQAHHLNPHQVQAQPQVQPHHAAPAAQQQPQAQTPQQRAQAPQQRAQSTPSKGGRSTPRAPPRRRNAPRDPSAPRPRFQCQQCPSTFSRKDNLATHMRVHTGERPFTCRHCDRKFMWPSSARTHELTHSRQGARKRRASSRSRTPSPPQPAEAGPASAPARVPPSAPPGVHAAPPQLHVPRVPVRAALQAAPRNVRPQSFMQRQATSAVYSDSSSVTSAPTRSTPSSMIREPTHVSPNQLVPANLPVQATPPMPDVVARDHGGAFPAHLSASAHNVVAQMDRRLAGPYALAASTTQPLPLMRNPRVDGMLPQAPLHPQFRADVDTHGRTQSSVHPMDVRMHPHHESQHTGILPGGLQMPSDVSDMQACVGPAPGLRQMRPGALPAPLQLPQMLRNQDAARQPIGDAALQSIERLIGVSDAECEIETGVQVTPTPPPPESPAFDLGFNNQLSQTDLEGLMNNVLGGLDESKRLD